MKVLTVLGTIALPAIAISGIYGMNLKGLPFEDSPAEPHGLPPSPRANRTPALPPPQTEMALAHLSHIR